MINPQRMRPVIRVTMQKVNPTGRQKGSNLRLMMEKINSAKRMSLCILSKSNELTFSEVPDTKNIDETHKEAE